MTRLLSGDRHQAEDIVQEALLRCWRRFGVVAGPELRPWLFTVAKNLVIDMMRSRKARPQEVDGMAWFDQDPSHLGGIEAFLTSDAVMRAMKTLSLAHREVLFEIYFVGNTSEQAARKLGLAVGTVKSRSHYGLRALREVLLRKDGGVELPGWGSPVRAASQRNGFRRQR
ncbi:sigma-70 family RNA polymerase sigma factor [Streptomyces sp. IB201691-2A2]|nr:sigma-70 family RNA polymerase sigma factor [Streptomyces sp. IB201691-2A2]